MDVYICNRFLEYITYLCVSLFRNIMGVRSNELTGNTGKTTSLHRLKKQYKSKN